MCTCFFVLTTCILCTDYVCLCTVYICFEYCVHIFCLLCTCPKQWSSEPWVTFMMKPWRQCHLQVTCLLSPLDPWMCMQKDCLTEGFWRIVWQNDFEGLSDRRILKDCLTEGFWRIVWQKDFEGLSDGRILKDCLTEWFWSIVWRKDFEGLSDGRILKDCLTEGFGRIEGFFVGPGKTLRGCGLWQYLYMMSGHRGHDLRLCLSFEACSSGALHWHLPHLTPNEDREDPALCDKPLRVPMAWSMHMMCVRVSWEWLCDTDEWVYVHFGMTGGTKSPINWWWASALCFYVNCTATSIKATANSCHVTRRFRSLPRLTSFQRCAKFVVSMASSFSWICVISRDS